MLLRAAPALVGLLLASACNPPVQPPPGGSGGAAATFSGCGVPCDAQTPCQGQGMACLPKAGGGMVCKPATCPTCQQGKFCAYDRITCSPVGCTSNACGFAYTGTCDDCVKANCCAQNQACAADPACVGIVTCAGPCKDSACTAACESGLPAAAVTKFEAAMGCDLASCQPECFGGSTTSSSSSSSTTAAGTGSSTGSGMGSCHPPCLSNQSCVEAGPPGSGVFVCSGDACANVTCPTVICTSGSNSANFSGCQSLLSLGKFAAACNPAINSIDAAATHCVASPASSMHCVFPDGSIDCPAMWISPGDALSPDPVYVQGCCSDEIYLPGGPGSSPHSTPFCGVPATIGCAPIDPGNAFFTPAP